MVEPHFPTGVRSSGFSLTVKLTGTRAGLMHTVSSQAWYSSAPMIVADGTLPRSFCIPGVARKVKSRCSAEGLGADLDSFVERLDIVDFRSW